MHRLPTKRPPTHPGEMLLLEFLEPLGLTQVELAQRIGVPFQRINQIVKHKRAVTPDTALRLANKTAEASWITPACSCQAPAMFMLDLIRLPIVRLQLKPQPLIWNDPSSLGATSFSLFFIR